MIISKNAMKKLLCEALQHSIRKGTLHVILPDGEQHSFGGDEAGCRADWDIREWSVVKALANRGDIGLGETYTAGLWHTSDVTTLFKVFIDNMDQLSTYAAGTPVQRWFFRLINTVLRRNSVRGSHKNIRQHYDVGNDFYKLWLDPSMTYSAALFENDNLSLQDAQNAKYRRILERIGKDRKKVLEIGCGWGGFADLASEAGHHVTGLTLSQQQHAYATEKLKGRADILLKDYRLAVSQIKEKFDAVASIEMFEAVGQRYWPTYFSSLKHALDKDGVAMIQTITIRDDVFESYATSSDYIRHYVFPGGMLPSVEKFKLTAEKTGLACKDLFFFGQDYARTLTNWLDRFKAAEHDIRQLGYDEAFLRTWQLYLGYCAASFACGRTNVMQVEIVHV